MKEKTVRAANVSDAIFWVYFFYILFFSDFYYKINIPYIRKSIKQTLNIYRHTHCCEKCGKRHTKSDPLTFHHTNPILKTWNMSDIKYHKVCMRLNDFLIEINSCELLCRQCHNQIEV